MTDGSLEDRLGDVEAGDADTASSTQALLLTSLVGAVVVAARHLELSSV